MPRSPAGTKRAPSSKRLVGTMSAKTSKPQTKDRRPPLAARLPEMTDEQLVRLQTAAQRISREPGHAKHRSAIAALPLVDKEIGLRAGQMNRQPAEADASGD